MEATYTVLARRFRPQAFDDVVGQERVARTLRNAIGEGRVAHAYLFTGARGVGKTSMARIFAKALNCPQVENAVPCNKCEVCQSITAGHDVDVSEIDGASNRGIDDIRALRANVNIRSMRSPYKIYIIDEVHMLTKEAFNALLKTLEEPPPQVKFIFCTTEPNKVPDTILSRCQRFDFGVISTDNISLRLRQLAAAEGFQVSEGAIQLVARRAAGSMRDSQSLFDQLLAAGEKQISEEDVHVLLGTAPDEQILGLGSSLCHRNMAEALKRLDLALSTGVQLDPLSDQLVNLFRDVMVTAAGATDATLLSISPTHRAVIAEFAKLMGAHAAMAALQILSEAKLRMQRVTFGRSLLELAIVRIATLQDLDQIDKLIVMARSLPAVSSPRPATLAAVPQAMPPAAKREETIVRQPASPADEETQKKSRDLPPQIDSPKVAAGESPLPMSQSAEVRQLSSPGIEWKPENSSLILKRLQERLSETADLLGNHLARAKTCAISGPNSMEIIFPASYDLGRRACETPESLARVSRGIEELTGVACRVLVKTDTSEVAKPATSRSSAPAAAPVTRAVEITGDPFVDGIGKTFGIKSWIPQLALGARTTGTEPEPEAEVTDDV